MVAVTPQFMPTNLPNYRASVRRSLSKYGQPHSAPELLNRSSEYPSSPSTFKWGWIRNFIEKSMINRESIPKLCRLLDKVGSWDFDVNEIANIVPGNVLLFMGNYILRTYSFENSDVNFDYVNNFFEEVEQRYNEKAYHNSIHAADVLHTMHCFLNIPTIGNSLSQNEKLACLIAAASHDIGHFGLTNGFLGSSQHESVRKFGYESTLEKMHAALAIDLLQEPTSNVFAFLSDQEQQEMRQLLQNMILYTDLSKQSTMLNGLLDQVTSRSHNETLSMKLGLLLHAADIGHSLKPFGVHSRWAYSISEEFLLQGEVERSLGMEYSFGCNPSSFEETCKLHLGFLERFVVPVYVALKTIFGIDVDILLREIKQNIKEWNVLISQENQRSYPAP